MCEYTNYSNKDYSIWTKRWLIADCFIHLRMYKEAKEVLLSPVSFEILDDYLSIIKDTALQVKRIDVFAEALKASLIVKGETA